MPGTTCRIKPVLATYGLSAARSKNDPNCSAAGVPMLVFASGRPISHHQYNENKVFATSRVDRCTKSTLGALENFVLEVIPKGRSCFPFMVDAHFV